jgi:hypothetical protein
MFWKRNNEQKGTKLAGPMDIPEFVSKHLANSQIIDAETVPFLKAVIKGSEKGEKPKDILIFDPSDAEARGIKVQNFDSLKQNLDLIIAEGWFDEASKKVEVTSKKSIVKIKYFTYEEILQQIEALKDSNSNLFFYTNAGSGVGGPLGRGAAVIKLNHEDNGKKVKKYGIYSASVVDMTPAKSESKIFDSDKANEIAKWVAQSHKPRFF